MQHPLRGGMTLQLVNLFNTDSLIETQHFRSDESRASALPLHRCLLRRLIKLGAVEFG